MLGKIRKYFRKPFVLLYSKIASPTISGATYGVISEDPPIIHVAVAGNSDQGYRVYNQALMPLFKCLANRQAYFLYTWWWYAEDDYQVEIVKRFEEAHSRKYPKHRFIHLCNTPKQEEVFREGGLRAEFLNPNCLVDERVFRPLPSVKKIYDAVYDARLKKYKRHYLARNLKSLALIYAYNRAVDIQEHMHEVKTTLSQAHYFNHRPDGAHQTLRSEEVNRALNAGKVGLCLSQREGAMYASIQYLLCGLPLVSTRSQGGRDVFFDDEYVEIVDDDPESVRKGVIKMIQKDLSPVLIREKTLRRIEQHRKKFKALVQSIYQAEGVQASFLEPW